MTATEFGAILTDAATDALLYIAAGVGAGAVIFVVWLGIRQGMKALRTVGK